MIKDSQELFLNHDANVWVQNVKKDIVGRLFNGTQGADTS